MDRGLVGYSLQGHRELDMTEATQQGMAERERERVPTRACWELELVMHLFNSQCVKKKKVEEFGVHKTFITFNWL